MANMINKYRVHISGFFGYDAVVYAASEEDAKDIAEAKFDNLETSNLYIEANDTAVFMEKERENEFSKELRCV